MSKCPICGIIITEFDVVIQYYQDGNTIIFHSSCINKGTESE